MNGLGDLGSPREAVTLLRLEGITASAVHRAAALGKLLAPFGTAEMVEDAASQAIWSSVRDVQPFAANGALGAWPVWRIVCPPASGGALGERLSRDTGGDVIYDWGGGLIWAALPPKPAAWCRQSFACPGSPWISTTRPISRILRASDRAHGRAYGSRRRCQYSLPPVSGGSLCRREDDRRVVMPPQRDYVLSAEKPRSRLGG